MSERLLATAIGRICGRQSGLYKLVLPRSLAVEFKQEVARSIEAVGGVAVRIGNDEGEYSAGEAIAFRTPEDNAHDGSIVLVAVDGQSRGLKSLETFRDALAGGMPGGVHESTSAIVGVEALARELAELTDQAVGVPLDKPRIRDSLMDVIPFLSRAYREAGNDEKRWTDAFWLHIDMLVDRLPAALKIIPTGSPGHARDAVFASAGLPRPAGVGFYAERNSAKKYAKIIAENWSSQEAIERSLVAIDMVDDGGSGQHALTDLDWSSIATSRALRGHPLLSVAYHSSETRGMEPWLHGWASTSERAFFQEQDSREPNYELAALNDEGRATSLDDLGWQGVDHVLPPYSPELGSDGQIILGRMRLRLMVDAGQSGGDCPARFEVRPASAAKVDLLSCNTQGGVIEVTFELSRRAANSVGKWREKPFTLSVSPVRVVAGSNFVTPLNLKICAPHPARPTLIALEERRAAGKPLTSFAADGHYAIDADARAVVQADEGIEPTTLKLSDGQSNIKLAVIGAASEPILVGGRTLQRVAEQDGDASPAIYSTSAFPENPVVEVDGYQVAVEVPEVERGNVNPLVAAITGEPVIPAEDALRDELMSDPRGWLEQWYMEQCIAASPSSELRSCFGACVLEASGRGAQALTYSDSIKSYSNTGGRVHLEFPAELAQSSGAKAFWQAFDDLDLGQFCGAQEVSAWPSTLDLRDMSPEKVDAYLDAFARLLDEADEPRAHSWLAYPFSALLFNQQRGEPEGVLISPLHPLRMAWSWSVQKAGGELVASKTFGNVASSFLRFVDGELLPLTGPATRGSERWVSAGLAPGPRELFAGWVLLTGTALRENHLGKSINLLGLELPFGAPSGLDQGGVSSALRDYMRVYPSSPQLRIGLAAPSGGERYVETDEAIIAASGDLLARRGDELPGGVRIFDASNRKGNLPSAVNVLQKILPEALQARRFSGHAPFEWTTDPEYGPASNVDIQFIEDTVVRVRAEEIIGEDDPVGTSGPSLPFNRFRSWRADEMSDDVSGFALGLQAESFGELPSFRGALAKVESLKASGAGIKLASALRLGENLLGDYARWTITGNRHLDPSVLSLQLRRATGELALWEWRPAFLSRDKQKASSGSIASTHPYTVLARPSNALNEEVSKILRDCGMASTPSDVRNVIASLGVRGVGLSSLLTMGHTQSLGAMGFFLAFKALREWERRSGGAEIRCVVPMDAVFPLIDILGEGARAVDDQRRADLLLVTSRLADDGTCSIELHPVEVKMRSADRTSFPARGSQLLADPKDQLDSTKRVLETLGNNMAGEGGRLALVNAALATLVEAAFSLRPERQPGHVHLETGILSRVAAGKASISSSAGTLLWFQVDAVGAGGGLYEQRAGAAGEANQFFANPKCFDDAERLSQVGKQVAKIVEQAIALEIVKPSDDDLNTEDEQSALDLGDGETGGGEESSDNVNDGREDDSPHFGDEDTGEEKDADVSLEDVDNGGEELTGDEAEEGEHAPLGIDVLVGHRPRGATMEPVSFRPSETALNQLNVGVVGDLGTGKTQFLKSLVFQLSRSAQSNRGHSPKVFIFDYKRDYSEGEFPEALGAKILDPSKSPLPINFFALGVDADDRMAVQIERVRRANFFCDLLRRISGIGQVQRNDLYSSVMQAYQSCAHGHAPSINDVFDVYSALGKNDSVVSVLTLLRDLMIFETDPENTTTFVDLFDRSTVLNLSGLSGAGQDIVDIVATMFLDNLYTDYMKTLPKEPFLEGPDGISRRKVDSFVLIDEAHHAMNRDFDVLMKLMLEGREFGMGVVLSSQFLSHFDAGKNDWGEALSTWVVHNVRNASAKQFERIGFRHDVSRMVQEVTGLETHWAYYRCVNGYNEGILMKGQPFFSLPR